jgi:hypothetical protein
MKKLAILLLPVAFLASCSKCDDDIDGVVCTQELRMITLKVKSATDALVTLDSFYTLRPSRNERIQSREQAGPGVYVVLDDSYHRRLVRSEDNFRFVGWKNGQTVVDQTYRIAGDDCHIYKKAGMDSVVVQ